MPQSVAVFALNRSLLGRRLAAALGERGCACHLLSLDAPVEGLPVTIAPDRIVWEGVDLLREGAIFLELPLYSWPQPHQIDRAPADSEARIRFFTADREARSLTASAIAVAAESVPVVNRPEASAYAAAPATALEDLEAARLPVHPWSLGASPPAGAEEGRLVLDAAGREHWHRPSRPPEGEVGLLLDPLEGPVTSVLTIGGDVAGRIGFPSAAAWAAGRGGTVLTAEDAAEADLARRAAARLGLEVAAIALGSERDGPTILFVEAGPDLAGWDQSLGGRAVPAIAERLAALARRGTGEPA